MGKIANVSWSVLAETRTLDPLIKSQLLYQLSYEDEFYTNIKPRNESGLKWELTGSNRRPSACKADALNQLS